MKNYLLFLLYDILTTTDSKCPSKKKKERERDHVLAKMYYMIDMESGNIDSARDLKMDYIKRNKRLNKEDTCIHTQTVPPERGIQKNRRVGK